VPTALIIHEHDVVGHARVELNAETWSSLLVHGLNQSEELELKAVLRGNCDDEVLFLFASPVAKHGSNVVLGPSASHELLLGAPLVPLRRHAFGFQALTESEWHDYVNAGLNESQKHYTVSVTEDRLSTTSGTSSASSQHSESFLEEDLPLCEGDDDEQEDNISTDGSSVGGAVDPHIE